MVAGQVDDGRTSGWWTDRWMMDGQVDDGRTGG